MLEQFPFSLGLNKLQLKWVVQMESLMRSQQVWVLFVVHRYWSTCMLRGARRTGGRALLRDLGMFLSVWSVNIWASGKLV